MVQAKGTGTTIERTPEERAAVKAQRAADRLRRDRVRMLDGVQTMLRHAAASLATNDIETHDGYVDAAESQLDAYKTFVELSVTAPSTYPV